MYLAQGYAKEAYRGVLARYLRRVVPAVVLEGVVIKAPERVLRGAGSGVARGWCLGGQGRDS